MSGHSKWAKIKRQKGVNDAKRGNLFTKLAKNITLAAKEGGGDLTMNFTLRLAVDKAKAANMPLDNIKRAIDRGSGKANEDIVFQRLSYEAFGPGGTSVIIDCQTDNTNRTYSELRNLVESKGGKFASTGSVSWQFSERGLIVIELAKIIPSSHFGKDSTREEIEVEEATMEVMEIEGVEDLSDISLEDNIGALEVITLKEAFSSVLKKIESLGYKVISAELVKIPNEKVKIIEPEIEEKVAVLIDTLEEHDDVDAVWVNI